MPTALDFALDYCSLFFFFFLLRPSIAVVGSHYRPLYNSDTISLLQIRNNYLWPWYVIRYEAHR